MNPNLKSNKWRKEDLNELLEELTKEVVTIIGKIQEFEFGKFR